MKINYTGCGKDISVAIAGVATLHYGENEISEDQYNFLVKAGFLKEEKKIISKKEKINGSD